jgi:hypothetical protein
MFPFSIEFERAIPAENPKELASRIVYPKNDIVEKHKIQTTRPVGNKSSITADYLRVRINRGIYQNATMILEAVPDTKQINLRLSVDVRKVLLAFALMFTPFAGCVVLAMVTSDYPSGLWALWPLTAFFLLFMLTFVFSYRNIKAKAEALFQDIEEWARELSVQS